MGTSQGWFESDEDYRTRIAQEANERTIEDSTGSAPSQRWFESDRDYRARTVREANERRIEDSTGSEPSRRWFESESDYDQRIGREANERTVHDWSGAAPSQGSFEADQDYDVRVRREANERLIEGGAGSLPKQGWLEGNHEYRSRIAHEARELRARGEPNSSHKVDSGAPYSSTDDGGSSSGTASALWVGMGVVVLTIVVIMMLFKANQPTEEQMRAVQIREAAIERERARRGELFRQAREVHGPPLGSFTYCQNCEAFYPGKSKLGDDVIVWDAGIEHKNVHGRTFYLPFDYISSLEKHETRRKVVVLVLPEHRYPAVHLDLSNGLDGSLPPVHGALRTAVVFDDDSTRDAFYETLAIALSVWRERFHGVDAAQERERWLAASESTAAGLDTEEERRRRRSERTDHMQQRAVSSSVPTVGPRTWYYCQSTQTYSNIAPACPEPWVKVPAR